MTWHWYLFGFTWLDYSFDFTTHDPARPFNHWTAGHTAMIDGRWCDKVMTCQGHDLTDAWRSLPTSMTNLMSISCWRLLAMSLWRWLSLMSTCTKLSFALSLQCRLWVSLTRSDFTNMISRCSWALGLVKCWTIVCSPCVSVGCSRNLKWATCLTLGPWSVESAHISCSISKRWHWHPKPLLAWFRTLSWGTSVNDWMRMVGAPDCSSKTRALSLSLTLMNCA